jgi:Caudovirus prohead serine protease
VRDPRPKAREDPRGVSVGAAPQSLHGTNRVIRAMKVHEISPVTFPAYKDHTDIAARSEILSLRAGNEPYGDVDYADPGYQADGKKRSGELLRRLRGA